MIEGSLGITIFVTRLTEIWLNQGRIRLGVVGSRTGFDEHLVHETLDALMETVPTEYTIVSGGARGVDRWAGRFAREKGIELWEFLPDWETQGKSAGMIRNASIVKNSDAVIAFWDGESKGTKNTIDRTVSAKKPVLVLQPKVK